MEYSGFTFDSLDVHFGFGGTGTPSADGTGVFDNILINGTAIEPECAFIRMR